MQLPNNWVNEKDVTHCMECKFCGRIVCDACSHARIPLAGEGKVRACNSCAQNALFAHPVSSSNTPVTSTPATPQLAPTQPVVAPPTVAKPSPFSRFTASFSHSSPKLPESTSHSPPEQPHTRSNSSHLAHSNSITPEADDIESGAEEDNGELTSEDEIELGEEKEEKELLNQAEKILHQPTDPTSTSTQQAKRYGYWNKSSSSPTPSVNAAAITAAINSAYDLANKAKNNGDLSVSTTVYSSSAPVTESSSPIPGASYSTTPGTSASEDEGEESTLTNRRYRSKSSNIAVSNSLAPPHPSNRHPLSHSFTAADGKESNSLPPSYSSSNNSHQSGALKLDLPLKLCLVILKKSAHEMKERYNEYIRTKSSRGEYADTLSFHQFMFFSTIRTLPDFLFKKTELAYCMMLEEGQSTVGKEAFIKYSPILTPLASRLDAPAIFAQLATTVDNTYGITLPTFKQYVENLKKVTTSESHWSDWRESFPTEKSDRLLCIRTGVTDFSTSLPLVGRIGFTSHHLLFEAMLVRRRRCIAWVDIEKIEKNEGGIFGLRRNEGAGIKIYYREFGEEEKKESNNSGKIREEKDDSSPAANGGNTSRTSSNSLTHSQSSPLSLKDTPSASSPPSHPNLLYTNHSHPHRPYKINVLVLDMVGFGHESTLERQRTFAHIRLMWSAHHLSQNILNNSSNANNSSQDITENKLLAAAILQETYDALIRMRAMEGMGPTVEPMRICPLGDFTPVESEVFTERVKALVNKNEQIKNSKKSWFHQVLPGLSGSGNDGKQRKHQNAPGGVIDDIDPTINFEYKSFEEMNNVNKEYNEPFSIKALTYNVKLFNHEMRPIYAAYLFISKVRNWENPLLSGFTLAILLNMCYRDYLGYIPAIIIFFNTIVCGLLYWFPDCLDWVEDIIIEAAANKDKVDNKNGEAVIVIPSNDSSPSTISTTTTTTSTNSTSHAAPTAQPIRKHQTTNAVAPVGLFAKYRRYVDVAYKTKDHLQSVQNWLYAANIKCIKIEGLYKWRTRNVTEKYIMLCIASFFLFLFVPFRFIFPFILLDWFTVKWQRDGSTMERLLEQVVLPDRMPEFD